MEDKSKDNKLMFYAGILLVIISAILLLGNYMGESTFPTILGALGVIFIGASGYRLLK
jgi:uncharacterized membrane protein HdeD (DUF308 family)